MGRKTADSRAFSPLAAKTKNRGEKTKTPTDARRRFLDFTDCRMLFAYRLADLANDLHRAPVVGELLAAVEANHVMAGLAHGLPIRVATGARAGGGEGLGGIAMTTAQRQDLQEFLNHFSGPLMQ